MTISPDGAARTRGMALTTIARGGGVAVEPARDLQRQVRQARETDAVVRGADPTACPA